MRSRLCLVVAAAVVASGLFTGCAEERSPINRVQPNALPKAFFVGKDLQSPKDDPEFYTRAQVVDVGYGASQDGLFSASWGTAEMTRVKFVIQETMLIARLTYERIADSDHKGAGKTSMDGVIVAVYPILSHFDIKRAYNPTTGEELNVIEENVTDRPWYEREYMRVDFSKNLNVDSYDFDTLSLIGMFGGVNYEPLAYYVNDPNSEDAPHFSDADGYFDVTNKAFAKPQLIDLSYLGWGISYFPACYLDPDISGGGAPAATCNPVELTVRQSFRRVTDTDFEPLEWDGQRFQAYGAFYKDRYGYARDYGMSDDLWHRLASHYNIWERSHYYDDATNMTGTVACFVNSKTGIDQDAHRDLDNNGTEDECEAVTAKVGMGGSRCDTFKQKCTLPLRARKLKPVAWYVTTGSNPQGFEGTDWATQDWDVAFRAAVAAGRNAECHSTAADDASHTQCDLDWPIFKGQMEDITEAIRLATEVDSCRHGKAYKADADAGKCNDVADRLGLERGLDSGIIAIAKMDEMIVLCHSPVEANDPPACAPGMPRLAANLTAEACYNAREQNDQTTLAECNKGLNVHVGDLRYHTVNLIAAPQDPSAWGIMLDSNDPLSGETISASINIWTHINDLWSQSVVDLSRVIKGELKVEDVTDGQYVKEWVQRSETGGGAGGGSSGGGGGAVPAMTGQQVHETVANFAGVDAKNYNPQALAAKLPLDVRSKIDKRFRDATKNLRFSAKAATATSRTWYDMKRQNAVGSAVEATLMEGPAMQQFAGVDTSQVDANTVMNLASPLRGGDPALRREIRQRKELALAERGACAIMEAPAPLANAQLADVLEAKFGAFNPKDDLSVQFARAEKMRKYIYSKAQHSVIVHEMGHSIGMRHNFVSSADAFAYRPQYWQLRTNDGKVTKKCLWTCTADPQCTIPGDKCTAGVCTQPASASGDPAVQRETLVNEATAATCLGPRFWDPTTPAERKNLIWMWMQSTTMDYAGETTQDMIGLGVWDFAAARMFYGNAVAVYADDDLKWDPKSATKAALSRSLLGQMDSFGGILGIQWDDYRTTPDRGDKMHYTGLQEMIGMVHDCTAIPDVSIYKPAAWDADHLGEWSPLLDGQFVAPAGDDSYTHCKQRPVAYVPWQQLRMPEGTISEGNWSTIYGDFYQGGPSVDPKNRVRVPYGFATDTWADLGNASVYRHDNGADLYELFDFLISQQETQHIFVNYRRHRQSFSVRVASDRALERYNEKMRDAIKGLGLMANVYKDFAIDLGYGYTDIWPYISGKYFRDNILASSVGFDFFTRQMGRPSSGLHFINWDKSENTARSALDTAGNPSFTVLTVPEGAYGIGAVASQAWGNVGFGGRLLENKLAPAYPTGEYRTDYTMNCGSYYDKAWTPMLMTESVDNFISDSRRDFVDPRYRSVSVADVFPEGYRRWLANSLTGDEALKAPRAYAVAVPNAGVNDMPRPVVEMPEAVTGLTTFCLPDSSNNDVARCGAGNKCCANPNLSPPYNRGICITGTTCAATPKCGYEDNVTAANSDPPCADGMMCCQGLCTKGGCYIDASHGMGWVTYLPATGPEACFWSQGSLEQPLVDGAAKCSGDTGKKANSLPIDPQIGWEQQKFLIAMTLQYLPENQRVDWLNMMRVYEAGKDADPNIPIDSRIELHDPTGKIYMARTYGTESIFGTTVQKGIAARVLEYANDMLNKAYACNAVTHNGATWYEPILDSQGQPLLIHDDINGLASPCISSAACMSYANYMSVPAFMRQVLATYYQGQTGMKGLY